MASSGVGPITFDNSEFKPCDPTKPGPTDCIMIQQNGAWIPKRMLANQSWPATLGPQLAYWHTPQFGYFNSVQSAVCGTDSRAALDNTCLANGVPVTPAMLSAPFSKNPGPWNMDSGKYLFQLTQPIPPLTGMSTQDVLVQDKDVGTSGM